VFIRVKPVPVRRVRLGVERSASEQRGLAIQLVENAGQSPYSLREVGCGHMIDRPRQVCVSRFLWRSHSHGLPAIRLRRDHCTAYKRKLKDEGIVFSSMSSLNGLNLSRLERFATLQATCLVA
jgi:hypothetical protein